MGLFRRTPTPVRLERSTVELASHEPPRSLWADGFGRLSIRVIQVIILVILATGLIWGLRQVTVVVIPLILALILASAFAPVLGWMRRHGVPALVATLLDRTSKRLNSSH